MKKTLLLLLTFFTITTFSQTTEMIEKVAFLIKKKPTSIEAIDSVTLNLRQNKDYVTLLIKESEKENYLEGRYYAYRALGRIYRDISVFDKSLEYYKKALEITKQINNTSLEIKILNSIGSVYRRQDDIPKALNYHLEALDKGLTTINPTIEIKKSISISQNGLGNLYTSLKQYELALEQFKKSIVVQKELNNKLGLAINYQNIGNVNQEIGNLDCALENYHKSLHYNNLIHSRIGRVICGYSIANVLIKQKKYNQALITADSILPMAIQQKDKYYLSNTYNTLGLAQIHNNKLLLAKKNLEKALTIAKDFNILNVFVKANENLALLYEKQKHFKKAFIYYKKAKEEEEKTFNDRNLLYLNELSNRYEKQRTNNKIKDLAKQNKITQLQLSKTRNIFFIILSFLALFIVVWFSIHKQQSLQNEKNILSLKQEVLQNQMNPHFVFNALNSIKLYIINNEQKNAVRYLNKFAKLIRKILEASKVKETTLAEELETMDLYMSIENIRFNNEIDYTFKVNPNINVDSIKVPPLVLQPFLENAIWHGLSSKEGNKNVTLTVNKVAQDFLKITIQDNGIGRKASAKIKSKKTLKRKSIGIDLTKERLRSFVKDFEKDFQLSYEDIIENDAIVGTIVTIKIPLV